jgi:hypothetical protein
LLDRRWQGIALGVQGRHGVDWFQAGGGVGTGVNNTWYYGYAVDDLLGYPR